MTTRLFHLLPAILLILAGCGEPKAPPLQDTACTWPTIPNANLGESYTYTAQGRYDDINHPTSVIDWRAAGSKDSANGPLVLPAGSTLRIEIAESLVVAPDQGGQDAVFHHATTWVQRQGDAEAIPVLDDWLDPSTGQVVRTAYRNSFVDGDSTLNSLRFHRNAGPSLLAAPLIWRLNEPEIGTFQAPFTATTPFAASQLQTYAFAVTQLVEDACQVQLAIDWQPILGGPKMQIRQLYANNTALPTSYLVYTGDEQTFALHQKGMQTGKSDSLADWNPAGADRHIEVGVPDFGFLSDTNGVFHTSWNDAVRAVQQNLDASTWFNQHPKNDVTQVIHVLGANPDVPDQWSITWNPRDGTQSLKATITSRPPILSIPANPTVTTERRDATLPYYDGANDGAFRTSLEAAAQTYARLAGDQVEVLACFLDTGTCGIGSHATTSYPKAGATEGELFINPGLTFDIQTGALYQVQAWGDAALGPPAQ